MDFPSIRLHCPNSKNSSLILLSSSTNLIQNGNYSTWWDSTSSARIEKNLARFISFARFACSKSFPIMCVISFWMRRDKYVAFFLEGFPICFRKGSFFSANNLRMTKKLAGFWLLLISPLCPLIAMHCWAQSMFTQSMFTQSINHFKISLFLRTFSAFKLLVKHGNVSSRFSNRFFSPTAFSTQSESWDPTFTLSNWLGSEYRKVFTKKNLKWNRYADIRLKCFVRNYSFFNLFKYNR